jgi:hypothetical protein
MAIEHTVKVMPATPVIQAPKAEIAADKVDFPTLRTENSGDDPFCTVGMTVTKMLKLLRKPGGVCLNGN